MPERISVRRPDNPRIVRPVATPVSAYVAPAQNTPDQQLANSLSELAPALSRFSGVLQTRKATREKEAGEAAAREIADQGRTLTEAVRNGDITPDQNPWFRVGAYETFGRSGGLKYIGDFLSAFNKSAASESIEMKDFDAFERDFRQQWVSENLGEDPDPFLANAFGSTVDGQLAGLRNEFARGAGQRLVKQNAEAFHAEIFGYVQRFQETDLSVSERAAALRVAQERQVATGGMTYDQVNRLTASAVAAAAVRLRDTTVLDMLDQIPTDLRSRGFLGGTSYGTELREKAESAIARAFDDDQRRIDATNKREREATIQTTVNGMVDVLQRDPGADITPFVDAMRQVDATYLPTLFAMRDTVASGRYTDDPDMVRELTVGIFMSAPGSSGYTTQRMLDNAFASRRMTYETYRALSKDIQARDEAGGSGKFLRNPILQDIANETRRIFASEYREDTPGVRFNAQQAADEAQYLMLQWLLKNPDAAPEQILTAQSQIRERVVNRRIGIQQQTGKDNIDIKVEDIPPGRFYLVDPIVNGRLERELQEVQAGSRNGFSPDLVAHLRRNGLDPNDRTPGNLREIQKLVREQTDWLNNPAFKP